MLWKNLCAGITGSSYDEPKQKQQKQNPQNLKWKSHYLKDTQGDFCCWYVALPAWNSWSRPGQPQTCRDSLTCALQGYNYKCTLARRELYLPSFMPNFRKYFGTIMISLTTCNSSRMLSFVFGFVLFFKDWKTKQTSKSFHMFIWWTEPIESSFKQNDNTKLGTKRSVYGSFSGNVKPAIM